MTLDQLQSLTEDELAIVLHVVNKISPPCVPKMEFGPNHLTWFKHGMLIQKLVDACPHLLPEAHSTYLSLMEKLGVKGEIKTAPIPPPMPISETVPLATTSSVGDVPTQPLTSDTTGSL